MKLITEQIEDVKFLTEARADGTKDMFITGPFIVTEQKNKNGRIYPMESISREVQRYINEKVNTSRAYGELDHPSGPTVNLKNVSHIITELNRDGNVFVGKAKLTSTPMGNIARGLIESGASLGVSSRGMGNLIERNGASIVEDYHIATAADIVSDPSAPGAFVQGIMENVEWVMDPKAGWQAINVAENVQKHIKTYSAKEIRETAGYLFEQYLSQISKISNS